MIYKPLIKYNAFLEKLHSFFNEYLYPDFMSSCVVKQDVSGLYWIGFSGIPHRTVWFLHPVRVESDFSDPFLLELKDFFTACEQVSRLALYTKEDF